MGSFFKAGTLEKIIVDNDSVSPSPMDLRFGHFGIETDSFSFATFNVANIFNVFHENVCNVF